MELTFRAKTAKQIAEMSPIEEQKKVRCVARAIEHLKESLAGIVGRKPTLTDPEIIAASEHLDDLVNEYYRLRGWMASSPQGSVARAASRKAAKEPL